MKYLKYFIPIWGIYEFVTFFKDDEQVNDGPSVYMWVPWVWWQIASLCALSLGVYKLIQLL